MKNKKHDKVLVNYNLEKIKHLERLATKMVKKQEILERLREKKTSRKFLDLF